MAKINILVNKEKVINVKVYVKQEENENLSVVSTLQFIEEKDKSNYQEFNFVFRQPLLSDLSKIIENSFSVDGISSNFKINPITMRIKKMEVLLTDWDLTDEKGNKIPITKESINTLSPSVLSVVGEVLDTITQ